MGRGHTEASGEISVEEFHAVFEDKISAARASSADAPQAAFAPCPFNCVLQVFTRVTVDDVIAAVHALPNKQCASDHLPTSLLKGNILTLAPFLVELFNRCLPDGSDEFQISLQYASIEKTRP